jgi:uncharacterized membrane protein
MMFHRNTIADLLKGLAVLFMIQVHIIELFASPNQYSSHYGFISLFLGASPVAPVFMIVLGYYLSESKKTTKQLIVRSSLLFGLGLLLNLGLNFNLICSVISGKYEINLLPFIFGVDILLFAGLACLFISILKKQLHANYLIAVLCILLFPIMASYLSTFSFQLPALNYVSAFFIGNTEWSFFPFFTWISYPLVGFVLNTINQKYDLQNRITAKLRIAILLIVSCFTVFTFNYSSAITSQLQLYYHHTILFFAWTLLFLSGYYCFVIQLYQWFSSTKIISYIAWVGKNVTYIYCIQWLIIGNVATEIYKTLTSIPLLMLCTLGVILVSSGITYGLQKIIIPKKITSI